MGAVVAAAVVAPGGAEGVRAAAAGFATGAAGRGAGGRAAAGGGVAAGLAATGAGDAAATPAGTLRGAAGGGTAAAKAAGVATIGGFAPVGSSTRGASAARKTAPHRHLTRSLGSAALSGGMGMERPQPTQRTVICGPPVLLRDSSAARAFQRAARRVGALGSRSARKRPV